MNMYLFFKNLNILCIFRDRFFDPVFFRFRFLGLTGSMTGPVLVTLISSVGKITWNKSRDESQREGEVGVAD